jgi:hypothetical protein
MWVVALPAEITLAVGAHLHSWYLGRHFSFTGMTLATEFPRRRLLRQKGPRGGSMLLDDLVACLAVKRNVMGHRLGPGDLGVTRSTRSRGFGGCGVVGIVTIDARLERVVKALDDLGKSCWPSGLVLVAIETRFTALSRYQRYLSLVVFGVCRGRSVADLARQSAMIGAALGLVLPIVALGTHLPTGVLDRLAGDRCERVGTVVADLPEGLRNEAIPDDDQRRHRDHDNDRQAEHLIRDPPESQTVLPRTPSPS